MMVTVKGAGEMEHTDRATQLLERMLNTSWQGATPEQVGTLQEVSGFLAQAAIVVQHITEHNRAFPQRLQEAGGEEALDENPDDCAEFYAGEATLCDDLLREVIVRMS